MPSLFRRTFIQNFGLKAISLLLAVGLWLVVAREPVAEVEMKVPIEFHNFSENLEIDSATFTEAQVRVRGPERVIRRLSSRDVRVEVDLKNVQRGTRTFALTTGHVRLPQDLEVVQVIPTQFQLSFDERVQRTIEVRPRVTGNFAQGMRVARVVAEPSSIAVIGPRGRVEAVESATTDPVDVSGTMDRATFVTHTYVPDPLIQVVHPTPIRVTVIMERAGEEKKPQ